MAESVINTLAGGLEQVRAVFADYSNLDTTILSMIKISKVAEISRWGYRVPYVKWRGGLLAKVSLDGGALADGTGPKQNYFTAGYIPSQLAFELTDEQIRTSKNGAQAVKDVLADLMANVTEIMSAHDNIHFLGDGTGFLTNASSAKPSATTLTFAGTTDTLHLNRIFKGMAVDIWDSAGTTLRAGGPYVIDSIDYENGIVTFTSAPTGLTSGDRLAVANVDEFGPAAPTTKSSTWPGDRLTNGAGMTGDSWRHGVEYVNSAVTSEYYLGRLKSTYPELMPTVVNGGTYSVNWDMLELAKNKLEQARDKTVVNGLIGLMHNCQRDTIKENQVRIANWDISSSAGKYHDFPPQVASGEIFNLNGVPGFSSKLCDKARIDYVNPANWGRVESEPPDYYREPDGTTKFKAKLSSSKYTMAWQFWIISVFDWVCHDPGASMYLSNLAVKKGYRPTETYAS